MRILSVAYPLTQVGADAVGGSEQILTKLDHALEEAGHTSIVVAASGSQVKGRLVPGPAASRSLAPEVREHAQRIHKTLIKQALDENGVDLVHMHSLDFHRYLPERRVPVLATLHLPPDWYPEWIFQVGGPHFHLNCVSRSEECACPKSARIVGHIPNGVPVEKFEWQSERANFVLGLGRICPEKGFHVALDAARLAGVDMLLAGELFPYPDHEAYYRKEILPRLDGRRRFLGPLGFARKRDLLAKARCLLIPSTVAETSSLVAMEAMASGTPVIAFPSGALPEIITEGVTGFLASNASEMAAAIANVDGLSAFDCRMMALARFSVRTMAARYFELYDTLIKSARKADPTPAIRPGAAA